MQSKGSLFASSPHRGENAAGWSPWLRCGCPSSPPQAKVQLGLLPCAFLQNARLQQQIILLLQILLLRGVQHLRALFTFISTLRRAEGSCSVIFQSSHGYRILASSPDPQIPSVGCRNVFRIAVVSRRPRPAPPPPPSTATFFFFFVLMNLFL